MTERSAGGGKKIKMTDTPPECSDLGDSESYQDSEYDSKIAQLEMIHTELERITDKQNEEILALEQKYKKMKQHYYNKRSEIIETIPDFWPTVFTSHPAICHIIYDEEEDCMRYLKKLEIETPENVKSGYTIKLYFNENPYFKNSVLEKKFVYAPHTTCLLSTCTKIEWKKMLETMPVPLKDISAKNPKKRFFADRTTFFRWFIDNRDANTDIIAEIIKDDVWINCMHYYLVPDPDMEGSLDKTHILDLSSDGSDSSSSDDDVIFVKNLDQPDAAGEGASTSK